MSAMEKLRASAGDDDNNAKYTICELVASNLLLTARSALVPCRLQGEPVIASLSPFPVSNQAAHNDPSLRRSYSSPSCCTVVALFPIRHRARLFPAAGRGPAAAFALRATPRAVTASRCWWWLRQEARACCGDSIGPLGRRGTDCSASARCHQRRPQHSILVVGGEWG